MNVHVSNKQSVLNLNPITWDHAHATDYLLQNTRNLTQPFCFDNYFSNHFLNENDIKVALNTAIRHQAKEYFRVWIGKNERHDLAIKISQIPIEANETIEQWSTRIFGNQKFCIFFNWVEQFNDDLTNTMSHFLKPIYDTRGIQMGGASMVLFIGNYGYTPSGLHQDHEDNAIFHFHLGPGIKRMYTLEPTKFEELTGSKNTLYDYEKILEHANCFELRSNSFFSMPAAHYHIGQTDNFSIGLGVVLTDATNLKLTQDIFKNIGYEGITRVKSIYKLNNFDINDSFEDLLKNTIESLQLNPKNKQKTLEEFVTSQIEDRYFRILSNLSWTFPPLFENASNIDLTKMKIKLQSPYKIYYKKTDPQTLSIFMRGRELIAKYHFLLERLIETINFGAEHFIETLMEPFILEGSEKLAVEFIVQAIEYRAVKLNSVICV